MPPVLVAVHVLLHLVHREDHVRQREQRGRRARGGLGVAHERPRRGEPRHVHVAHHRVEARVEHRAYEDLLDEPHPEEGARRVPVVLSRALAQLPHRAQDAIRRHGRRLDGRRRDAVLGAQLLHALVERSDEVEALVEPLHVLQPVEQEVRHRVRAEGQHHRRDVRAVAPAAPQLLRRLVELQALERDAAAALSVRGARRSRGSRRNCPNVWRFSWAPGRAQRHRLRRPVSGRLLARRLTVRALEQLRAEHEQCSAYPARSRPKPAHAQRVAATHAANTARQRQLCGQPQFSTAAHAQTRGTITPRPYQT